MLEILCLKSQYYEGGMGGENFTILPENGVPYSYDQRAIPYIENPSARYAGNFDNELYFDVIDAIRNNDLQDLNQLLIAKGKHPISTVEFVRFSSSYIDFQNNVLESIGKIDGTYDLKGIAAPWQNSATGNVLLNGGAEQMVTPLRGEMLKIIGVLTEH